MADIECRYCRAMNDGEERRCTRCGRRLSMAAPRSAPDTYPLASGPRATGAAATAAATVPVGADSFPEDVSEHHLEHFPEPGNSAPERASYQPSLFRDGLGSPKVIPIPTLTPLRVAGREGVPVRRATPRTKRPANPRASRRPRESSATFRWRCPRIE
jgi:hypothetical protein